MDMKFLNHTMTTTSSLFRTLGQTLGIGLLVTGLLVAGAGCDSGGNGGDADTEPPPAPSGLELSSGDQQVDVQWSSVDADDLAGYAVRRSSENTDAVSTLTPVDTLFTDTSHTDTGVRNGTRYTYWVVAVDEAGNESERSSQVDVRPFASPPDNPQ